MCIRDSPSPNHNFWIRPCMQSTANSRTTDDAQLLRISNFSFVPEMLWFHCKVDVILIQYSSQCRFRCHVDVTCLVPPDHDSATEAAGKCTCLADWKIDTFCLPRTRHFRDFLFCNAANATGLRAWLWLLLLLLLLLLLVPPPLQ